jgi:hypothetical protein
MTAQTQNEEREGLNTEMALVSIIKGRDTTNAGVRGANVNVKKCKCKCEYKIQGATEEEKSTPTY